MTLGRAVGETDAWVRALARATPAPVEWDRVVLSGVGIAAPVGLALLLAPHDPAMIGVGSLASMGALVASAMDTGDVGIERVRRMALATIMATVGFALGTLVYGHSVLTLIAVIAATVVSGLSAAVSATVSRSAVYFLMFAVTSANTDFGLTDPWTAPFIFFLGATWRVMLTAVAAALAGRDFGPERRSVALVYTSLADQLAASGTASTAAAATLTNALNGAYDAMVAARTEVARRDGRWQMLVALLDGSAPVVDAVIAATQATGRPVDGAAIDYLRRVAAWIEDPHLARPEQPHAAAATPLGAALRSVAHIIDGVGNGGRRAGGAERADAALPAVPTISARWSAAARAVVSGSEMRNSILRLVLCMTVAQALSLAWDLAHPYLVMLTVAQVMKPDFGSVFARAVQRAVGTLIGVGVGALIIVLVPAGGWQVLVIFMLAASIPIVMPRNYGLYSIVTTPLAVLLVEIHAGAHAALIGTRLFAAVLGCAIVLLLGYLPWPATWHAPRNFAHRVSELAQAIAAYARTVAAHPDADTHATARRGVYRGISDLRTLVGRSAAEPPAIAAAAASWLPVIAVMEAVADAVTAVTVDAEGSAAADEDSDLRGIGDALDSLAADVASHRPPRDAPLPSSPRLAAVTDAVVRARATVRSQQRKRPHRARTVRPS